MMMVHTFCTLKEAAATLRVSEEQVEALLQNGLLREFRQGPYRLLRAAEVEAFAAAKSASPSSGDQAEFDPSLDSPSQMRLPHCAAARAPQRSVPRPRNSERVRQPAARATSQDRARVNRYWANAGPYPGQRSKSTQHVEPSVYLQAQSLSLREWLWSGLTEDRPVAIAILFILALILLAALAAGVCLLAEGL